MGETPGHLNFGGGARSKPRPQDQGRGVILSNVVQSACISQQKEIQNPKHHHQFCGAVPSPLTASKGKGRVWTVPIFYSPATSSRRRLRKSGMHWGDPRGTSLSFHFLFVPAFEGKGGQIIDE